MPRQIGDTLSPVLPSLTYCMLSPYRCSITAAGSAGTVVRFAFPCTTMDANKKRDAYKTLRPAHCDVSPVGRVVSLPAHSQPLPRALGHGGAALHPRGHHAVGADAYFAQPLAAAQRVAEADLRQPAHRG